MDYLDRQKEFRQHILLITGYILVAVAIVLVNYVMVNLAAGYGLNNKGQVIQKGLTFFSSHPSPANIYINGQLQSAKTNTRLSLPSGIYGIKLTRNGYYDWQRKIEVRGGSLTRYDYPFFFPTNLSTKAIQDYSAAPGFMSESPDRHWLVVQQPGSIKNFDVYDLKNPAKPPASLALPDNLLGRASRSDGWQLGEWADDNRHLLLKHVFDGKTEFIVMDRATPGLSLNLNTTLSVNPYGLTLNNRKYDSYYLYDQRTGDLRTASLSNPTPVARLKNVLAYKSYGSDTVLYVTGQNAPKGKVLVRMVVGSKVYDIRKFPAGSGYVLDLTKYSGVLYVAVGADSENRVYIYKDPIGQLNSDSEHVAVSSQVLHVGGVNFVSFSATAQYIVAEHGSRFGVYDIENQTGYNYTTSRPLDKPQLHASWMDGNRLAYVSGARLVVFDYDNTNAHLLMPALGNYLPAFAPDYKFAYALARGSAAQPFRLTQTSLLAPPDR